MSTSSSDLGVRAERLRALTLGRAAGCLLLVVLLSTLARPLVDPIGWGALAAVAAVHLAVQGGVLLLPPRREGSFVVATELTLLVDVTALALVLALTGGPVSPLAPLLLTVSVAVTLVFGRWAGIRASLLATIAVLWVQLAGPPSVALAVDAAERSDVALAAALTPTARTALLLAALWATTAVTGWLSDVTERDLRRRTEDLAMLREVTPDLDPRQGVATVTAALVDVAVTRLGYAAAAVWVPGSSGWQLAAEQGTRDHPSIVHDGDLGADDPTITIALADDAVQPVARHDDRPAALTALFGPRSGLVLVPLRVDGRPVGLLAVEVTARLGRSPTVRVREVRVLRMLAEQSALLLDNARLQAELTAQAVTDAVTGLPNHRFLQQRVAEELDRVRRAGDRGERRELSFVLFDLDHFKTVNDTYGHPTGDRVLRLVAEAAAGTLRGSDVVCRYGGEEFGIVLVDTDADGARLVCERVRDAIASLDVVSLDDRRLGPITASFGVATVAPGLHERPQLVAAADTALYAAKDAGRNRVVHADDVVAPASAWAR